MKQQTLKFDFGVYSSPIFNKMKATLEKAPVNKYEYRGALQKCHMIKTVFNQNDNTKISEM